MSRIRGREVASLLPVNSTRDDRVRGRRLNYDRSYRNRPLAAAAGLRHRLRKMRAIATGACNGTDPDCVRDYEE